MARPQMQIMDDSLEAQSVIPVAASPDFDLQSLAASPYGSFGPEPPRPQKREHGPIRTLCSTVAAKVALSIVASIVGTMIIQSATMLAVFRALCAFIGLAGDPKVQGAVERLLHQGQEAAAKVEAKVDVTPPVTKADDDAKPSIKERMAEKAQSAVTGAVVGKVKDAAEDAKEAATERVDEVKKDVGVAKDKVEKKADDVVDVLKGKMAGGQQPSSAGGEPSTLQRLREQQKAAAQAAAHRAQCPYCGTPVNLPASAHSQRGCHQCGRMYLPAAARAAAQSGMRGRFGR